MCHPASCDNVPILLSVASRHISIVPEKSLKLAVNHSQYVTS